MGLMKSAKTCHESHLMIFSLWMNFISAVILQQKSSLNFPGLRRTCISLMLAVVWVVPHAVYHIKQAVV